MVPHIWPPPAALLRCRPQLVYAHGQGVLHRDIKPANLLVDTRGTVWITDFGLAKADGSDGPTRTGDVLGTLRYMAPERFEGGSDRRSDVYALGATLYELLTLQPIFGDINRAKLLDRIQHEPPAPPRRLDRRIPRDLETIVLKALAKEPAQRYRDAEAMAADLRRFIDDRPILTRRVSTTEQVWRWCRRNPMVAGLLALVLALLVGGAVAGGLAANHFRALAESESLARGRADSLVKTERQANELATRRAAEAQAARAQADAKAREAQAVADFLVMDLIGAAAPGKGRGTQTTIGEALARADATIDARFADQPVLAAAIHVRLGHTYWALTDAAKSLVHYRAAAELRARHLGPNARETLAARELVAVAVRDMGNREEARTIGEDVLERQRRALGPEDPDTLDTMLQIGGLFYPSSDDRASKFYRELHETLSRVVGPEDVRTINALHWYALTMLHHGDYAGAEATLRQVLELRLRDRGEIDATTFWTMRDLVSVLVDSRQYDAAWLEADRFWAVMARNVNPDDVHLKETTELVLAIAAATSDWARAETLFRRESKALAADLGPGNVRTLHARALLARALAEQGRSDGARAMAGEVLDAALEREAEAGAVVSSVPSRPSTGLVAPVPVALKSRGGSGPAPNSASSPETPRRRSRRYSWPSASGPMTPRPGILSAGSPPTSRPTIACPRRCWPAGRPSSAEVTSMERSPRTAKRPASIPKTPRPTSRSAASCTGVGTKRLRSMSTARRCD